MTAHYTVVAGLSSAKVRVSGARGWFVQSPDVRLTSLPCPWASSRAQKLSEVLPVVSLCAWLQVLVAEGDRDALSGTLRHYRRLGLSCTELPPPPHVRSASCAPFPCIATARGHCNSHLPFRNSCVRVQNRLFVRGVVGCCACARRLPVLRVGYA